MWQGQRGDNHDVEAHSLEGEGKSLGGRVLDAFVLFVDASPRDYQLVVPQVLY